MHCNAMYCPGMLRSRISGSSDKRVQCACTHSSTVQSILGFRDTMTGGYSVHVLSQDGQSISEYSNKGYSVHVWYSFWYCPMMQCQSILGTQNTLTRGVVCMCSSRYRPGILGYSDKRVLCMCSSWYCPVIVRAS